MVQEVKRKSTPHLLREEGRDAAPAVHTRSRDRRAHTEHTAMRGDETPSQHLRHLARGGEWPGPVHSMREPLSPLRRAHSPAEPFLRSWSTTICTVPPRPALCHASLAPVASATLRLHAWRHVDRHLRHQHTGNGPSRTGLRPINTADPPERLCRRRVFSVSLHLFVVQLGLTMCHHLHFRVPCPLRPAARPRAHATQGPPQAAAAGPRLV